MSLLSNNTQILKEAYFGNSNYLKQAVKHIDELMEVANKSDSKYELSKSRPNKKLEEVLAKQFGVKSVNIHWMRVERANFYTRPYISQFSGISEYVNRTEYEKMKIFKNSEKEIYITGTDSFLTNVGLTPEEVLACILHEIGHNFDTTVLKIMQGLPVFWMSKIMSRAGRIVDLVRDSIRRKISKIYDPIQTIWFLYMKEMTFMGPIQRIQKIFSPNNHLMGPNEYIKTILGGSLIMNAISTMPGYGGERFADSFATSYGYGPEIGTALMKLQSYYKENTFYGSVINSIPVLNSIYSCAIIFGELVSSITGVHPENGTRIKASINKLRRDLNDPSIDPALKKAIQKDLDAMEQVYEDYLSVKDIPEFKTGVLESYRRMNDKVFGSKLNIHEILNKLYEEEEV